MPPAQQKQDDYYEEPACTGLFNCFGPSKQEQISKQRGAMKDLSQKSSSIMRGSAVKTVPPPEEPLGGGATEEVPAAIPDADSADIIEVIAEDVGPEEMSNLDVEVEVEGESKERGLPMDEDIMDSATVAELEGAISQFKLQEIPADVVEAALSEAGSVIDLDTIVSAKSTASSLRAVSVNAFAGTMPPNMTVAVVPTPYQSPPADVIEMTPDVYDRLMVPKPSWPVFLVALVFWPMTLLFLCANYSLHIFKGIFFPAPKVVAAPELTYVEPEEEDVPWDLKEMDPRVIVAFASRMQDMALEVLESLKPEEGGDIARDSVRSTTMSMKSVPSAAASRRSSRAQYHPIARDSVRSAIAASMARESMKSLAKASIRSGAPMASADRTAAVALARESLSNLAKASKKLQSRTASMREGIEESLVEIDSPHKPTTPERAEAMHLVAAAKATANVIDRTSMKSTVSVHKQSASLIAVSNTIRPME